MDESALALAETFNIDEIDKLGEVQINNDIEMEPPPGFIGNMDSLFLRNISNSFLFLLIILSFYGLIKFTVWLINKHYKEYLI